MNRSIKINFLENLLAENISKVLKSSADMNTTWPEKGKPSVRVGRKATGPEKKPYGFLTANSQPVTDNKKDFQPFELMVESWELRVD